LILQVVHTYIPKAKKILALALLKLEVSSGITDNIMEIVFENGYLKDAWILNYSLVKPLYLQLLQLPFTVSQNSSTTIGLVTTSPFF